MSTGLMSTGLPKGAAGEELQRALLPGERILDWAQGKAESYLIITDQRAIFIKVGITATGALFGRKVDAWGYDQISGVEYQVGAMDGHVGVTIPGVYTSTTQTGAIHNVLYTPNLCVFSRRNADQFSALAQLLRARIAERQHPPTSTLPPADSGLIAELKALANLRAKGVITEAQFTTQAVDILTR